MTHPARTRRGAVTLAALLAVFLLRPAPTTPVEGTPAVRLPILMYHHLLKDASRHNPYTIAPADFAADLDWLLSEGYQPITMAELLRWSRGEGSLPLKPVMITFDDGYESFYEYAWPILRERNCPAVFSVIGREADRYTEQEDHHISYSHCSWPQLQELAASGLVELQNHSYDLHTYEQSGQQGAKRVAGEPVERYQGRLEEDVGRMQRLLRDWCGAEATTFTYPFGSISPEALPVLQEMGFSAALTCRGQVNLLTGDPAELYTLGRFNRPAGKTARQIFEEAGLAGEESGVK